MKKISNYQNFLNKMNESVTSNDERLLSKIDYTLLKPEATEEDIIELCEKADILGVKSVCVLPKMVKVAAESLQDSDVLVCTVVSFPHGTDTPQQKLSETKMVIADGADEVDMVLNYIKLKQLTEDGEQDYYFDFSLSEIRNIVQECHKHTNKNNERIILKVIVESGLLNDEETKLATHICLEAGADFIKTSTGMVAVGAELNKVQIMKKIIQDEDSNMKIKASGGIKSMSDLQKFDSIVDRFGVGFGAVDNIFSDQEKTSDDGY